MLYQKGTQRIEVIVKKASNGGIPGLNDNDADEISADATSSGSGGDGLSNEERRRRRFIKTNTSHFLSAVHKVADLKINYNLGGRGYENGDQNYQDACQRYMERVQDTSNFATSVIMGITYGSWGGPAGAAFGALFGAITTGTSLKVKYDGRERDYDYKMFKDNNAIEYNRARANINLTTGRLR